MPDEFQKKPIRVTPDSALSFLKPGNLAFDEMLLRFAREYVSTGKVVWDIGANVGIFSVAAAVRGGDCLAIEADPWLYSLLCQTQEHPLNADLRLTPLNTAVSAAPGVAQLNIARRGRSANYIEGASGSTQTGGVRKKVFVPALSMDLLMKSFCAPDIIKIDIEGAEQFVFDGATELFSRCCPVILVEVQSFTRSKVYEFLLDIGYIITDYESGKKNNFT
jgi:FkbM family methyltransferase